MRKEIATYYDAGLKNLDGVTLMPARDVVWMYDLLARDRDGLRGHLEESGIETRTFFKPMSRQPMYRFPGYSRLRAYHFAEQGLYLPTLSELGRRDQDFIIERVREFALTW